MSVSIAEKIFTFHLKLALHVLQWYDNLPNGISMRDAVHHNIQNTIRFLNWTILEISMRTNIILQTPTALFRYFLWSLWLIK